MDIVDLTRADTVWIEQVAALLVDGFREQWPDAWPDRESALQEVRESFAPERVSRVALDDNGTAIGWIGGIRQYDGLVWELHPLVVRADWQRRGVGRALVQDLEAQVQQRGALTLWLGTDDERAETSLGGVDLYPNVVDRLRDVRNLGRHPFTFYQKLGFVIVGVVPDANGPGKPDILMAKRVGA